MNDYTLKNPKLEKKTLKWTKTLMDFHNLVKYASSSFRHIT